MKTLTELRTALLSMDESGVRNELAFAISRLDSLERLQERLEEDFAVVLLEIAAAKHNHQKETYETSLEFGKICKRRGIDL